MSINFQHPKIYQARMIKIFVKAKIYRSGSIGAEIFYFIHFQQNKKF